MGLKGTQTEKNILTAFAGESQARNRYTYFASKARSEGYRQISEIFDGNAPHNPRGCVAQAWSVGEVLRAKCLIDATEKNMRSTR